MTEEIKNNDTDEAVVEEKENVAEEKETTEEAPKQQSKKEMFEETIGTASKTINDAFKQVESLGKALGSALQDRANVVMVRVNNDSLSYLDMLIEADITKGRSESAAFLISEGIKVNEELFNKIRNITDQIVELKTQLRQTVEEVGK